MKILTSLLFFSIITSSSMIFDFNKKANISQWKVLDDIVMGGKSSGNIKLNKEKNGVFYGSVSTENYGGFTSVRYNCKEISTKNRTHIILRVKGDGKKYQFRIKSKNTLDYSYITKFETTGEWQSIKLFLTNFYPSFRGRKLEKPNFNHSQIEEIAILIGNSKNESFELVIDSISIE
jgi:NADH dehydrogenase [ubiquinone] 1 alpha subcomplex assembly factor 1